MMSENLPGRSYAKITKDDLKKLLQLAHEDRQAFFERHPRWKKLYGDRIICIALCQGAALHYIDTQNGVKDFDVWTFYSENGKTPFPYRRMGHKDFGPSKFGPDPKNKRFKGRCVDFLGRSLKVTKGADPIAAIQNYLRNSSTKSAAELNKKAVVMLYPDNYFGKIIWPKEKGSR